MAEDHAHPQRELPLGSRTRGPGQPVAPSTPTAAPTTPMLARQVALAAERQAVVVRRLRWRESLERRRAEAAPPLAPAAPAPAPGEASAEAPEAMPGGEARPTRVSSAAVLRTLLARTGRRIRRSLGLDARSSDDA